MTWLKNSVCVALLLVGVPVAFWGLAAVAPFIAAVLLPGSVLWQIVTANRPQQQKERQRVLQARRKADQIIQLHLVAHGLPDTPLNRARMLHGLARGTRR